MLTAYEQHLVLSYLTNAVRRLHRRSPESKELFGWISENSELLPVGSSLGELCEEGARCRKSRGNPSRDQWDALRGRLTTGEHGATRRVQADRLASRLRRLGREMQLSRTDVAILEIMLRYRSNPVVEDLLDSVFEGGRRHFRRLTRLFNVRGPALPCLLGMRGTTFLARFEPDAPLVKSGLIVVDEDGDVTVIDRLHRLASGPAGARYDAHALLLDAAPPGELEWSDFDHVAEARDHVEALLRGALRAGAKGVNVLVHGEPGRGRRSSAGPSPEDSA